MPAPLIDRILLGAAKAHCRRVLRQLRSAADLADTVQERLWRDKIRRNTGSDYGRDHGFATIRTYRDFVRQVPVTRYDALTPYIDKVKAGRLQAMFGGRQRVHMFAMTSGTVDQPKYVPVTDQFLAEYRRGWNAFGFKALLDHPGCFLRSVVQVSSPMDEERTACGIPCGAITGLMAAAQKRLVRKYYAAPLGVARITDATARYYTVMRLAAPRDVAFMVTANPATQLRLAQVADQRREQLVRDVRDGTLDDTLEIADPIRRQVERSLRPDPTGARRLAGVIERTGRLLPKDYWRLGFLANWTGGTMRLYLNRFPEYFGAVPVRDIGLLASEGRMSIPLADGTPAGVLDVTSHFYEFIPEEEYGSAQPTVLRAHDVECDQRYYVLLTTSAGFYRYDVGDLVRVVEFLGRAPVIEFLTRGAHVSSLAGEKLTEQQVVLAFERVMRGLGQPVATFVLAACWGDPPFYRLHVDAGSLTEPALAELLAQKLDQALAAVNIEYGSKRRSARLAACAANPLPAGFLAGLDTRLALRARPGNEQYKHKYLYNRPGEDADFPITAPAATS